MPDRSDLAELSYPDLEGGSDAECDAFKARLAGRRLAKLVVQLAFDWTKEGRPRDLIERDIRALLLLHGDYPELADQIVAGVFELLEEAIHNGRH